MKLNITLIIFLLITTISLGQKKDKIKGNKEVVDIHNILADFQAIEISDELKVTLQRDEINKYHLETDQNLVEVIKMDVVEGVLKIYTTHNIQARKALNLTIYYNTLKALTIMDDVALECADKIEGDAMVFIAMDNAKFELDFEINDTTINLNGNARGELILKGEKVTMMLSDSAAIDGDFKVAIVESELKDKSDAKLKGNANTLTITASDNTDIKTEGIQATTVKATIRDNAEAWVHATKEFTLYAKDKTTLYLSGEPAITIEGFTDKTKLVKK